jgi:hypothetical protein
MESKVSPPGAIDKAQKMSAKLDIFTIPATGILKPGKTHGAPDASSGESSHQPAGSSNSSLTPPAAQYYAGESYTAARDS